MKKETVFHLVNPVTSKNDIKARTHGASLRTIDGRDFVVYEAAGSQVRIPYHNVKAIFVPLEDVKTAPKAAKAEPQATKPKK